jgi:hypothetical protein
LVLTVSLACGGIGSTRGLITARQRSGGHS